MSNNQSGPQITKLNDRLLNRTDGKVLRNFDVEWGEDAHKLTVEERAYAINRMLDSGEISLRLSEFPDDVPQMDAQHLGYTIGQRKRHSILESAMNVAIGYVVAIAAQRAIFPMFGIHVGMSQNLGIGAAFTVVSLIRSYALRRLFNAWHVRGMS
jgi:hypothetical protein